MVRAAMNSMPVHLWQDELALDETDAGIVRALYDDPYSTNRVLSRIVGIHEIEVARRIRLMDEANQMRLMAVLDIFKAGYAMLAHMRLTVAPRQERALIGKIRTAPLRRYLCALHTTDTPGLVEATLRFSSHAELSRVIREDFSQMSEIVHIEADTTVSIDRYRLGVTHLALPSPDDVPAEGPERLKEDLRLGDLDDLDICIVGALQQSGRTSSRELGRRFDVAEGTIRNRLAKLDALQLMKIIPILDIQVIGVSDVTRVRASVRPADLEIATRALLDNPYVSYLAQTTGQYNLHFVLTTPDRKTTRSTLSKLSNGARLRQKISTKIQDLEFFDHRWQVLSA